jgi:DNA-binding transcriptional LysR family regulator
MELYPEIQLSVVVDDGELDLSMREADVAIRMSAPRQPDLVQRHLLTIRYHIYAAPSYIKKYGLPQKPEDLDRHRIIIYGTDVRPPTRNTNWLIEAGLRPGSERKPILAVNNVQAIFRAVASGIGIAALPDYMAQDAADLVRLLPDLAGPEVEAYFVYPEELRTSKRIAVFRDFLLRKVAESKNT